jgi:hypothetical protein
MFDRKTGGVGGFLLACLGMAAVLFFFKSIKDEQDRKWEEPTPTELMQRQLENEPRPLLR